MDNTEDLSARVLVKNILNDEPPRTPLTRSTAANPSSSGARRSTRLEKKAAGAQTPQQLLRRSLKHKIRESISSKALPSKRRTASVVLKRTPGPSSMLFDDEATPRQILKNILLTEPVKSPVVNEQVEAHPPQPSPAPSLQSSRPSMEGSGLDLPDLTIGNIETTVKRLARKRPYQSLNVTAVEKRFKDAIDAAEEESLDDLSSLSLSSSTSLSLKTPFNYVATERKGLRRKGYDHRKITEEDFAAAVDKREMGNYHGLSTGQTLGETAYSEGFTLGLSKLSEPDITTDIVHCNTALYAKTDVALANYSTVATQDKPTVMASQIQRDMIDVINVNPNPYSFPLERSRSQSLLDQPEATEDDNAAPLHAEPDKTAASQTFDTSGSRMVENAEQLNVEEAFGQIEDGPEAESSSESRDEAQGQTENEAEEEENKDSNDEEPAVEQQSHREDLRPEQQEADSEANIEEEGGEDEAEDEEEEEEKEPEGEELKEDEEEQQVEEEEEEEVEQEEEQEQVEPDMGEVEDETKIDEEESKDDSQEESEEEQEEEEQEEEEQEEEEQEEEEQEEVEQEEEEEEQEQAESGVESEEAVVEEAEDEDDAEDVENDLQEEEDEENVDHAEHKSQRAQLPDDELIMAINSFSADRAEPAHTDDAEVEADYETNKENEFEGNDPLDDVEQMEQSVEESDEEEEEEEEEIPLKTPAFVKEKRNFLNVCPQVSPYLPKSRRPSVAGPSQPGAKPKQKTQRKPRSKDSDPGLPRSYLMNVFKHFAKTKVSADVYPILKDIMDKFFDRLAKDLEAYAHHAGRSTIDAADCELLLRRQGHVNDNVPVEVLIEKYLRMDQRRLLIPIAMSGNVVFPKKR